MGSAQERACKAAAHRPRAEVAHSFACVCSLESICLPLWNKIAVRQATLPMSIKHRALPQHMHLQDVFVPAGRSPRPSGSCIGSSDFHRFVTRRGLEQLCRARFAVIQQDHKMLVLAKSRGRKRRQDLRDVDCLPQVCSRTYVRNLAPPELEPVQRGVGAISYPRFIKHLIRLRAGVSLFGMKQRLSATNDLDANLLRFALHITYAA